MSEPSDFYCVACGSPMISTRHPSGTAWRCECGASRAWFSDFGALDIGYINTPTENDSVFIFEEFSSGEAGESHIRLLTEGS